jgi:hypothetical protein
VLTTSSNGFLAFGPFFNESENFTYFNNGGQLSSSKSITVAKNFKKTF